MAQMTEEDEKYYKGLAARTIVSAVFYPLTTARTLVQLGYSPFVLSTRNVFFVFRLELQLFSYVKQLAYTKGFSTLWTGVESFMLSSVVSEVTSSTVAKYIAAHYPDMGGPADFNQKEEQNLTDHESFRRMLRSAIRTSIVSTFSVTCARAFTVVSIRQVAQIVGGETKYQSVFQALRLIGIEEGPGGFFSGLASQLIGSLIMIWGRHSMYYLSERLFVHAGLYEEAAGNEQKQTVFEKVIYQIHKVQNIVFGGTAELSSLAASLDFWTSSESTGLLLLDCFNCDGGCWKWFDCLLPRTYLTASETSNNPL